MVESKSKRPLGDRPMLSPEHTFKAGKSFAKKAQTDLYGEMSYETWQHSKTDLHVWQGFCVFEPLDLTSEVRIFDVVDIDLYKSGQREGRIVKV